LKLNAEKNEYFHNYNDDFVLLIIHNSKKWIRNHHVTEIWLKVTS
jgi:hypothetical protein